ncbi:MAG: dynamin family protein [Deltaproteobacteria bacterium]|jgi:GTPase Era involved in 16S rRNA processing|nr:dynamin family protein [Deltaproteobacteria bacterium]MCL5879932.1 dynamin family protein [Deltaproteobacteria bacterium]MDA8304333.1 dynamin family protein [Deltaproteobacteria bacterium]
MLDAYLKIKSGLIKSLTRLENTASSERVKAAAQLLCTKLKADIFSLVVVGQFKRGKSTFINALLGEDILPAAVIPLTSIITILGYGDKLQITVFFQNGTEKKIMREELSLYITEKHNPKNEKGVNRVEIAYPSLYLKNGVQIIDTPGIASVHEHNTQTTYEYLPSADAAMFIIGVDPPLTQAELQFLRDIKNTVGKTFFIQSKIDTVSETDREESLAFSKKVIEEAAGFSDVIIYPLSGKEALEGKKEGDSQKVKRSGLFNFEQSLEQFLVNEKGKALIQSVAEKANNLIDEEMLLAELEEKSLHLPLEELENNIATFKNFIRDSNQERIDSERLLAGEIRALQKDILEEDIEKLKQEKTEWLAAQVEEFAAGHKLDGNAKFTELIGKFIDVQIREIFGIWRTDEEKTLRKHLEEIFKRFMDRMNKILGQIILSSAELFGIPYNQIQMQEMLPQEIEFRFETTDEPGALSITIDLMRKTLPKALAHKLILKEAKEKAKMLVDMHCGKARYDFSLRMERLMRNYRLNVAGAVESVQNSVLKALESGIASRQNTAVKAASLEKRVRDKINILKEIQESLKN